MIEDFIGEARWPSALVAIVALVLWAFNVHEDRTNRQEIRVVIVHECAHSELPKDCGQHVRDALKAAQ